MTYNSRSQQTVLFLFAHNDDEFFVLPRLQREVAAGNSVMCVYTTDGAAYHESPERRFAESQKVLGSCGVPPEAIIPLGAQRKVRDGTSFRHLECLWKDLLALTSSRKIDRMYVPAWEGGHADHDAAHLLAVALARLHSSELFEFSLYHNYRSIGPFFWCMCPIPLEGAVEHEKVSVKQAISWLLTALHYPSQRRTFLGLLPFCLPQIVLRRALPLRRVPLREYRHPPYQGELFYESRFKIPYQTFHEATLSFIDQTIAPGPLV
jgi:LmbE family N-acetylglucosaminyl deacetylase